MVWCGVVWCGVVWCGVVWCGVVWCVRSQVHGRCSQQNRWKERCLLPPQALPVAGPHAGLPVPVLPVMTSKCETKLPSAWPGLDLLHMDLDALPWT